MIMTIRISAILSVAFTMTSLLTINAVPVEAQVEPEGFSYPVGLDPYGDNFLALRSLPSAVNGLRLAKLGPDTLFREIGRSGEWVRVRLLSGDTGWVASRYVACCRSAAVAAPTAEPEASNGSCAELWYRRNSIYKAAGYCFHTSRGIDAFGNAGCQFDNEADIPLSDRQRQEAGEIKRAELSRGCPR